MYMLLIFYFCRGSLGLFSGKVNAIAAYGKATNNKKWAWPLLKVT